MTLEVHVSQFWNGADQAAFENSVQEYINSLHSFNMVVGKPRPTAHPLIERAIKRIQKQGFPDQYVADYVVIDDSPPPPSLEDKKNSLMTKLRAAEAAAMNSALPHRKTRLVHLNHAKASMIPEEERTDEHLKDIELLEIVRASNEKIMMIAAQAESDIDDLTEQNIDSWQLPVFG